MCETIEGLEAHQMDSGPSSAGLDPSGPAAKAPAGARPGNQQRSKPLRNVTWPSQKMIAVVHEDQDAAAARDASEPRLPAADRTADPTCGAAAPAAATPGATGAQACAAAAAPSTVDGPARRRLAPKRQTSAISRSELLQACRSHQQRPTPQPLVAPHQAGARQQLAAAGDQAEQQSAARRRCSLDGPAVAVRSGLPAAAAASTLPGGFMSLLTSSDKAPVPRHPSPEAAAGSTSSRSSSFDRRRNTGQGLVFSGRQQQRGKRRMSESNLGVAAAAAAAAAAATAGRWAVVPLAVLEPRLIHTGGPQCQCTQCLCTHTDELCRRLLLQRQQQQEQRQQQQEQRQQQQPDSLGVQQQPGSSASQAPALSPATSASAAPGAAALQQLQPQQFSPPSASLHGDAGSFASATSSSSLLQGGSVAASGLEQLCVDSGSSCQQQQQLPDILSSQAAATAQAGAAGPPVAGASGSGPCQLRLTASGMLQESLGLLALDTGAPVAARQVHRAQFSASKRQLPAPASAAAAGAAQARSSLLAQHAQVSMAPAAAGLQTLPAPSDALLSLLLGRASQMSLTPQQQQKLGHVLALRKLQVSRAAEAAAAEAAAVAAAAPCRQPAMPGASCGSFAGGMQQACPPDCQGGCCDEVDRELQGMLWQAQAEALAGSAQQQLQEQQWQLQEQQPAQLLLHAVSGSALAGCGPQQQAPSNVPGAHKPPVQLQPHCCSSVWPVHQLPPPPLQQAATANIGGTIELEWQQLYEAAAAAAAAGGPSPLPAVLLDGPALDFQI